MEYFRPEALWGRFVEPKNVSGRKWESWIGIVMIFLALILVVVDLFAPPDIIVVAVEPLLMAVGGWMLSRRWFNLLLGTMAAGFLILLLSGDEHALTLGILFIVTYLVGLTAFELSDAVNQRRRFISYLEDQLRSPITLIRGYVSMAKEGGVSPEEALAQVDAAAEMLGSMLRGGALFRKASGRDST